MSYLIRHLDAALKKHFQLYKEILILLGARQVGKTTIVQKIFPDAQYFSVDSQPIKEALSRFDPSVYRQLLKADQKYVIIDEIHQLVDPGRAAKIFYDQIPEHALIVTGSSAFTIKNKASESLAGRKIEYRLFPLTFSEYLVQRNIVGDLSYLFLQFLAEGKKLDNHKVYPFDLTALLDTILIFGLYPGLISHPNDQIYLKNLIDSVVFKDLLELSLIENRSAALNLLKLLAYQIGSLVNYTEISSRLGIDVKTVKRYVDLFEQSYILFRLLPFSHKKRDEIGKMPKVYFYDVGLRNALIDNFSSTTIRPDAGALFENFIIAEAAKANYYGNFGFALHYWRTRQGSEIDLVLSKTDGTLWGVEIKVSDRPIGTAFLNRYPQAKVITITKENFYQ